MGPRVNDRFDILDDLVESIKDSYSVARGRQLGVDELKRLVLKAVAKVQSLADPASDQAIRKTLRSISPLEGVNKNGVVQPMVDDEAIEWLRVYVSDRQWREPVPVRI